MPHREREALCRNYKLPMVRCLRRKGSHGYTVKMCGQNNRPHPPFTLAALLQNEANMAE